MAAPLGAPAKPGTKHGLGRNRILIAGAIAVLLYVIVRRRAAAATAGDPNALPGATDGQLPGAPGADAGVAYPDLSPIQFALEGVEAGLSDLQTLVAETSTNAQSAADQAFLATQAANDAQTAAAASMATSPALAEPAPMSSPITAATASLATIPAAVAPAVADWRDETATTSGYSPGVAAADLAQVLFGASSPARIADAPPTATPPPTPIPVNSSPAPEPPTYPDPAVAGTPPPPSTSLIMSHYLHGRDPAEA